MSYSNGRIYTEETAGGKQIGVSIGDLMRCFGVVIRATYNGTTYRRQSSDLGVIVAKRQGDSFYAPLVVDGVVLNANQQWTVESQREVNPWARYRPIPCQEAANNVPGLITPQQRQAERYGVADVVDLYSASDEQAYTDYATAITDKGGYYLPLRPFGDSHWKRLADYVYTDNQGVLHNGVGYDHNARPDDVKVTITRGYDYQNGVHYLEPLIPEGQRTIVIPTGTTAARYHLPNDHLWMDLYYKEVAGQSTGTAEVTVEPTNEEWLSPMDLMGKSTYAGMIASVLRRVIIYRMCDDRGIWEGEPYYNSSTAKWTFWNHATDKVGGNLPTRPFDTYPNAWLDLTDSAGTGNIFLVNRPLSGLSGHCLFVDAWVESNSSTNVLPIPGFAYEVEIVRANIDINVDVSNVLTWLRVTAETDDDYTYAVVKAEYNPANLPITAGSATAAQIVAALRTLYDALTITIGTTTVNLLDTARDWTSNTQGDTIDWFALYGVVLQVPTLTATTATITATRKGTGYQSTKTINIV